MMNRELFIKEAEKKITVKKDASMKECTTFKIGGKADLALYPKTADEMKLAISMLDSADIPYYVVGRGSNLLVDDEGYCGAIIFTSEMSGVTFDKNKICADAGVGLTALSRMAGKRGLSRKECRYKLLRPAQ